MCWHFILQEIEWFLESRNLCRLHIGNEVSRLRRLYSLLTTCLELNQLIIDCQGMYSYVMCLSVMANNWQSVSSSVFHRLLQCSMLMNTVVYYSLSFICLHLVRDGSTVRKWYGH